MDLLTHSRTSVFRACPRKHYLAYEVGIRPDHSATPLRVGSAIHKGLECRSDGKPVAYAILEATRDYDTVPTWATPDEWELERETVARLLAGYYWHYESEEMETVQKEQGFVLPLTNPKTGRTSRTFKIAGVMDRIVKLKDGRLTLIETKTTGDDISSDSDYWLHLRLDQQISLYVIAARASGFDVETVLYDVIRKPSIRPKQVTKEAIREINFKKTYCHETIDPALLSFDRETPVMFGARLLSDIAERPGFYFARKEIPRLEADLDEFRYEIWQQAKAIMDARSQGRWYRNAAACENPPCPYRQICYSGTPVTPDMDPPSGYVRSSVLHPELKGKINEHWNHETSSAEDAATTPKPKFGDSSDLD